MRAVAVGTLFRFLCSLELGYFRQLQGRPTEEDINRQLFLLDSLVDCRARYAQQFCAVLNCTVFHHGRAILHVFTVMSIYF